MNKKEIEKPKSEKYYLIEVEAKIPCLIKYKVLAKDEKEALEKIKANTVPIEIKYNYAQRKHLVMKVYEFGMRMMLLMKRF